MLKNRKGFTLIELLIVVVIIGILAAIAIPKLTTKDKAKLPSVKTDIRNYMTAQEAYFSDNATFGQSGDVEGEGFTWSTGNLPTASAGDPGGYSITVGNTSISGTPNQCSVEVGTAAANPTTDGVITCQ